VRPACQSPSDRAPRLATPALAIGTGGVVVPCSPGQTAPTPERDATSLREVRAFRSGGPGGRDGPGQPHRGQGGRALMALARVQSAICPLYGGKLHSELLTKLPARAAIAAWAPRSAPRRRRPCCARSAAAPSLPASGANPRIGEGRTVLRHA